MDVTIVGIGLIGGSMAIDLRRHGFADRFTAVDSNPLHAATAVDRGLADRAASLEEGVAGADLVIVAVPVDVALTLVPRVLDLVEDQVVTDVCSTKTSIMGAVAGHPRRSRFVSAHPMAGTENSGPWAALPNLFESKAGIICNSSDSDPDAVALVERMYDALNMRLIHMQAADHDVHVAYVSHVSHVISFALALTVLEKERSTQAIFNLASGGFDSTARLAKSSADMWCPIFAHNRENILPVLDTYMEVLQRFRASIAAGDRDGMTGMIQEANRIRRVLAPK